MLLAKGRDRLICHKLSFQANQIVYIIVSENHPLDNWCIIGLGLNKGFFPQVSAMAWFWLRSVSFWFSWNQFGVLLIWLYIFHKIPYRLNPSNYVLFKCFFKNDGYPKNFNYSNFCFCSTLFCASIFGSVECGGGSELIAHGLFKKAPWENEEICPAVSDL